MSKEREFRGGVPAEIRADEDGIKVSGYAAVFNEETMIGGYFREVIKPGAFKEAIERDDVMFLVDHAGLPLARTRSGTLKLTEDDHGLRIDATLDPTDPDVMRVEPKMRRGDLDKMSFAFFPEVQEWDESGDTPKRTLLKVGLDDVSIVGRPAYNSTEISLRSLADHREQAKKELEEEQKKKNFKATQQRLRMKGHLALKEREKG